MKFIEKLSLEIDLNLINQDLDEVIKQVAWPESSLKEDNRVYHANQIGLTYRLGSKFTWFDASGSLYDKEQKHFTGTEQDFSEWNPVGTYTKSVIEQLSDLMKIKFGRIRYMRLLPKTGLSVHHDFEPRYHLVLKTNPHCYFLDCNPENEITAKAYHIPADGFFYKVDTTRNHTVYNGGWEPRIHLVLNEIK